MAVHLRPHMPQTLIVRLPNWLGDTVMAVPALRALRAGLPAARILLAGPWAPLLAGQDLADVLVDYPRAWSARMRLADTVRALGADTALLLPGSLEAALAARYWGARHRIGFATGGRGWLLTDAMPLPAPRRHQIDEYCALAERLGVVAGPREPRLAPPVDGAADRARARELLREAGAPAPGPGRLLVGVHVGAAHGPAKVWPEERTAELCRRLDSEGGVAVLLGAPADVARAERVARAAPALSVVGRDEPQLLPALLGELDALVAGDTGVTHLAAALGVPTVALFGPTDPRLTAPRGPAAVLDHPVPCAPCFYRVCPIDHPCLAGIGADAVAAAIRSVRALAEGFRR